jgi:altronate hydrolase
MQNAIIKIHPNDNVFVSLRDLKKGEKLQYANEEYTVIEDIPAKHKFYVNNMQPGDAVIMYGVLVGKAQTNVSAGSLVTTANLKHAAEPYAYRSNHYIWHKPDVSSFLNRTFNGYHRADGSVGTANYWLFIPTVFCENRNLDVIKEALHPTLGYAVTDKYKNFAQQLVKAYENQIPIDSVAFENIAKPSQQRLFKNVDGIKFLNHQGGCGGSQQDAAVLGKLIAAYANHPNVGGVTVISLGCQNLQLAELLNEIKSYHPTFNKPLLVFEQQQIGNETTLVSEALRQTFKGLMQINEIERKPAPLSQLTLRVKCGGSDGFSGISANPSFGYCADLVVALGGKVLLAEYPELCGVEQ